MQTIRVIGKGLYFLALFASWIVGLSLLAFGIFNGVGLVAIILAIPFYMAYIHKPSHRRYRRRHHHLF